MPIHEVHLTTSAMQVVALAGGVGGAKLVDGLAQILAPENLTVIVNIGDDFEILGLKVCPDLDTVCYTLAGVANPDTGWGRRNETWNVLESLAAFGGPTWFKLGDRDLALHLERTERLRQGKSLSQVTYEICKAFGVGPRVLPVSDEAISTMVMTTTGEFPFQEYFVRQRCEPVVTGFRFAGIEKALPAPEVLTRLRGADLVVLCPSNPWVSLDPILAVPGMRETIGTQKVLGISPIIGGQTVKGPAAKMFMELGIQPSALAVAEHYHEILAGFVMDEVDTDQVDAVQSMDILPYVTNTLMNTQSDRRRLALECLEFSKFL